MKLRRIVAVSAVLITLGLMVAMLCISRIALLRSFAELEQHHVESDLQRAATLLEQQEQDLDRTVRDYANWDDTYQFMANPGGTYVESNYSDPTLRNLGLQMVLLTDTQGVPVLIRTPTQDEKIKNAADRQELLRAAKSLGGLQSNSGGRGILRLSCGPVLIAGHPILTSAYQGPSRGVLLMVRALDEKMLSDISALIQSPLEIMDTAPDRDPDWKSAKSEMQSTGAPAIHPVDGKTLVGYVFVRDFFGNASQVIRLSHNREIFIHGQRAIQLLMSLTVVVGILFGTLNLWLINRFVVSRIEDLIQFTKRVHGEDGLQQRVEVHGDDEIANLGNEMNSMLDQMQHTHESLAAARERLEFQATHDGLTGVWNRAAALELLDRELSRCSREQTTVAVVMLDLDHFKQINDQYGHSAGDKALQSITAAIASNIRGFDVLARYGGEEFLIIAPKCSARDAFALTGRILRRLAATPIKVGESEVRISASAGVTAAADNYTSEDLIAVADRAMYRAKELGRNRVEVEELANKSSVRGSLFAVPQRLR